MLHYRNIGVVLVRLTLLILPYSEEEQVPYFLQGISAMLEFQLYFHLNLHLLEIEMRSGNREKVKLLK